MGFISRKIFPSCGNLCVCCPSLRPSSRRPVKRYKKLLAEIFPKTEDGAVNERKIMKLCEYAAKNPPRIPKIVKFLEQRSQKELRVEHVSFIKIVTEAYGKLLFVCKEQMAYFATSLVKVVNELLESKQQEIQILGCQTLTRFIYSQADNTYARNIESLVSKVCSLSNDPRENHTRIRASSLQCLSAMIWFMTEYSYMFSEFDEIVSSILKNYRSDEALNEEEDRSASHHNWVDEIVRCEGRAGGTVSSDISPRNPTMRIRPNTGDTFTSTREQHELPEMWAHECVRKLGELAKESTTTMRRVLDPMLIYFDFEKQWGPRHGLALLVLSDMSFTEKSFGNERLVLSTVIRHLDHKNVVNNPQMKADIVQVATSLVRQLRSRGVVAEMGVACDLCRHLRKCLEAIGQTGSGIEESNWKESLQNSLEDCLLEIVKGMNDVRPLFEMMALTLEKLSDSAAVARASIGSLLILSHIISLTSISSQNLTVFPEALLLQLLKAMTHTDPESRLGAHLLFSSVLVKTPNHPRSDSEFLYETKKWQSRTTSVFASATALLEKLRREKESLSGDSKTGNNSKERVCEKELKSSWGPQKSSVFFTKLGFSVFDRAPVLSGTNEMDGNTVMLTEDQTTQLLSAIWVQANQADNLPFNFEAIGHTFCLTLLASSVKNLNNGNVVRFFQLPLSLRIVALTPSEILPPACQRSLYTMAMSMLAFAGKLYNICKLTNSLKRYTSSNIDPYLRIGEDLLLYVRLQSDLNNFGSDIDHDAARCTLNEVREAGISDQHLLDIIAQALSNLTNLKKDVLVRLLSETFVPEDVPLFGSGNVLDWVNAHVCSEESLSLDEECSRTSSVDGGIANESPATNFSSLAPKLTPQPSLPNVISVGQLLESVLHVAGQVAVSSVSTSPLPYGTMASQCEALGMGSRKKLSSWLVNGYDSAEDNITQDLHMGHRIPLQKVNSCSSEIELTKQTEPWLTLKLPPASPFDNFLKAAGC